MVKINSEFRMKGEQMMEGDKRRDRIIQMLADSNAPISGAELAERLGVSRQVIVQDIALLTRAFFQRTRDIFYLLKKIQRCGELSA